MRRARGLNDDHKPKRAQLSPHRGPEELRLGCGILPAEKGRHQLIGQLLQNPSPLVSFLYSLPDFKFIVSRACFSCSEESLDFLLKLEIEGQKINLELKDESGYTPLHLAVKSVAAIKSTRPVRALLLKGADRKARNMQN